MSEETVPDYNALADELQTATDVLKTKIENLFGPIGATDFGGEFKMLEDVHAKIIEVHAEADRLNGGPDKRAALEAQLKAEVEAEVKASQEAAARKWQEQQDILKANREKLEAEAKARAEADEADRLAKEAHASKVAADMAQIESDARQKMADDKMFKQKEEIKARLRIEMQAKAELEKEAKV